MPVATPPSAARVSPDVLIRASAAEKGRIQDLSDFLTRHPSEEVSILIGGDKHALPASSSRAFRRLVMYLARDNAVTLVPHAVELTTQAAADLLGISRPHVVSLCERGRLRFSRVGTHRRLKLDDVLAYRNDQIAAHRKAMQKMNQVEQHDDPEEERPKLRRHGT